MQRTTFGFVGYATVSPPPGGFWRVSAWHAPLDPPPPAPPLGTESKDDDGHRYDDPEGRWRTLYCATNAEGALGECLGDFRLNTAAVARIEGYLESEPDQDFDEDYFRPLTADDVSGFNWKLAHAPATPRATFIDVDDWRTYPLSGELRAAGLRFTSRLPPAWECWALWEPLPLEAANAEIEAVTIDTPQLRTAAAMLGIAIMWA